MLEIFRERLSGFDFRPWLEQFEEGLEVTSGDLVVSDEMLRQAEPLDDLTSLLHGQSRLSRRRTPLRPGVRSGGAPPSRRLNKMTTAGGARYGG